MKSPPVIPTKVKRAETEKFSRGIIPSKIIGP
jgi:hypothetical protein